MIERRLPTLLSAIVALMMMATLTQFQFGCRPVARQTNSTCNITWSVTIPRDTPSDATVYLSGNLAALGDWNGHGVQLARADSNTFTASVSLPRGAAAEYKLTLGSWDTVEQTADHADIGNRVLNVDPANQAIAITVAAWRDASKVKPKPSTVTGDVRFHRAFHSAALNSDRNIAVWLPPGYDAAVDTHYPVLYMHDGQNVFDESTSFSGEWHADEIAAKLIAEKRIQPIIIVAFDHGGAARTDEYTPTPRYKDGKFEGGGSERTAHFLTDELKPFIDKTYRTLPDRANTAVAGSSLGGLDSLYLAWKHDDVFGLCGAISPSLWWDKRNMLINFEADNKWMKREKIWLDIGTAEGATAEDQKSAVSDARELHAIFQRTHLKDGVDYRYLEVENAHHDETAWSARFDQVLIFFFGKL